LLKSRSGQAKKKQVVETTCESHEKTSIGNFWKNPGKLPFRKIYFPGKRLCAIGPVKNLAQLRRISIVWPFGNKPSVRFESLSADKIPHKCSPAAVT